LEGDVDLGGINDLENSKVDVAEDLRFIWEHPKLKCGVGGKASRTKCEVVPF
jgi:hypothetical protein